MRVSAIRVGAALAVLLASLGAGCIEEPDAAERAYLVAFCAAMDRFSDHVAGADDAAAIRDAYDAYATELDEVEPPSALREFHEAFRAFVSAPGIPDGVEPPLPPSDVRERLAAVERELPECEQVVLFEREGGPGG